MSDDNKGYISFLEASVPLDETGANTATPQDLSEAVVDDTYVGVQSPVVKWDGKKGFPNISRDEKLNDVVDKILKRTPKAEKSDGEGTKQPVDLDKTTDPAGIKDGKHVTEDENNDGDDDEDDKKDGPAPDHKEPDGDEQEEMKESSDDDEDGDDDENDDDECPECDKKIQEIYQSLGISPLQMLEDSDETLQDLVSEDTLSDEDFELTEEENQVLESLINEMGLLDDELSGGEDLEEDEQLLDELDIELED